MTEKSKKSEGSSMATIEAQGVNITTDIREIGPEEAQLLLSVNQRNRNLRRSRVEALSDAMKRGEWAFNGDAIRVSSSGVLLDGQHRLAAVIRAEMPQPFLVISGLPDAAQETMDAGAKRTVGDALKLRGEKDVNRLAAIVRMVQQYEARQTFRSGAIQPTTQQIIATLARHPGCRSANVAVRPIQSNLRFASGPSGACYYLFSLVDPAETEIFFNRLAMGSDLAPRSPIFALRRRFTAPKNVNPIPSWFQGALCIKAFNMWRRGDETDHIRYNPGGAMSEKFPLIDGLDPEKLRG